VSIRVAIADDHAVVRQGLRTFLELQDDMEVVGEASDGDEAVDLVERTAPDVVLLDLVMPRVDGIEATRRIRERSPATRILVLTSFADDHTVLPAVRAGAAGYLLKDVQPPELAGAIRTVHAGEALLAPAVATMLVEQLAAEDGSTAAVARDEHHPQFTPREL
jgi:two-component system, NarL family, response regulator LiaR